MGPYRLRELVRECPLGAVHEARDLDGELLHAFVVRDEHLRGARRASVRSFVDAWKAMSPHDGVAHVVDVQDDARLVVFARAVEGIAVGSSSGQPPNDVAEVARVLAHAHAHGVVHGALDGDVVRRVGSGVAVVDFGMAACVARLHPTLAGGYDVRRVHGLAPELLRAKGATPTPASDVYALGVLAHEWFVGAVPHARHTSMMEIVTATLSTPTPPVPVDDGEWAALIRAMLAEDPARRPSAARVATFHPALDWPQL
ncbi:MAG: protein kinase [Polyangiales bacterium]